MSRLKYFSKFTHWLKNTELFYRPKNHIPGKWDLYEYYTELEGNLVHVQESDLVQREHHLRLELSAEEFNITNTIPGVMTEISESSQWKAGNRYISFQTPSEKTTQTTRYQYTIGKGHLKLLKKDHSGKIIFFGFFKPN